MDSTNSCCKYIQEKVNPKLEAIITHLNYEYSNEIYKYTVYRCALKISTLKKLLFTAKLQFKIVLHVLEKHHLNTADDLLPIPSKQLVLLLTEIFEENSKLGVYEDTNFEIVSATQVLASLFWNMFDPNRENTITLMEFKETFLLLCDINSFEQIITAFFLLMADHNRCVSRFRFECFLKVFVKLLSYLKENEGYGPSNIPPVLEQCFSQCPGINGLNEFQFHNLWTNTPTRFLVYSNLIALVKRIRDTEKLIHKISCFACKSLIIGIRFKCQSCRHLSLCMKCFAIGFSNNKHSGAHRMYEVFTDDDHTNSKLANFFSKLCLVVFSSKHYNLNKSDNEMQVELTNSEENEITFINSKKFDQNGSLDNYIKSKQVEKDIEYLQNYDHSICFWDRLQIVQEKISSEKSKINEYKNCLDVTKHTNFIEFLESHENNLKYVLEQINLIMKSKNFFKYPTSSTPQRLFLKDSTDEVAESVLSRSINGAEVNKSYLEANKSDFSLGELSNWFHHRKSLASSSLARQHKNLNYIQENQSGTGTFFDTDMNNFRDLLSKVKEIIEDSYSDNKELSNATKTIEKILEEDINRIVTSEMERRNLK